VAVRVELREGGVLVAGVEHWWDDVEAALGREEEHFALLESINPYGQVIVPRERLMDLADECRRLGPRVGGSVETLLLKIAELCDRAASGADSELRFDGD
jgi:hypothetical protein